MFAVVVIALFAYNICKTEIQCAIISHKDLDAKAEDSTRLMKNLTLLKTIENIVLQTKSKTPWEVENKKINNPSTKNKPHIGLDRVNIQSAPRPEETNQISISREKNLLPINDVERRQSKLFPSLAFLTGLGAGNLATSASVNANAFVKVLQATAPLPIAAPEYFTSIYGQQQYLPISYPVLYPIPRLSNNYVNYLSGIPVISPLFSPKIINGTAEENLHKNDTNSGTDQEANEQRQESKEIADTQTDSNEDHVQNIDPSATDQETESRQLFGTTTTTTTTARTTTTTAASRTSMPVKMNMTLVPNVTTSTTPPTNNTGSFPLYGYYGGSPQGVGHVILTTEDPLLRYVKDYTEDAFAVPFERAAVFRPYQNVEPYSNSFVNSFSSGDQFPEFFNTIESDRYVYDSENRRNINGFRPIFK